MRRQAIQAPSLLALAHAPARPVAPLLSPITPLARRLWEDLLARYAVESAGGEDFSGALAANRELLRSLSLLASLTQHTRRATARQAAATAAHPAPGQPMNPAAGPATSRAVSDAPAHPLLTSLPFGNPALPGLAAAAAMSASLAPVQTAIARVLEGPIHASALGGWASRLPSSLPQLRGIPTIGTVQAARLLGATSGRTGAGGMLGRTQAGGASGSVGSDGSVGSVGSVGSDRSDRSVGSDRSAGSVGSVVSGGGMVGALASAQTAALAGPRLSVAPGQRSLAASPAALLAAAIPFRALAAANRQLTAHQERAATDRAMAAAMAGIGLSPVNDRAPATLAGATRGSVPRSREFTGSETSLDRDHGPSKTILPPSAPRQTALRQIASSIGQPMAPVVRRMMERALGATFADVRVHTGSPAGGAAQALGAQAFTMGSDIYFAPGKFDPAAPAGLALLAHELTHTRQRAAVPLRKAAPGAPALEPGEVEPAHLEAEAVGTEAAVLRAFSGPAPIPVLARMVAGSYDALVSEREPGSESIWSGFSPRPALSGGGSSGAMAEGLAAWSSRASRASLAAGGASVQRQAAGAGVSSPVAAGSSMAAPATAGSSMAAPTTADSPSNASSSIAASSIINPPAAGPSPVGATPTASPASGAPGVTIPAAAFPLPPAGLLTTPSGTIQAATPSSALSAPAVSSGAGAAGPAVQRKTTPGLPGAETAGIEAAVRDGTSVSASSGFAAQSRREAGGSGSFVQRFAAGGTLLGDLARRRQTHVAPGAIALSPIFGSAGSDGATRVQRQASGRSSASYTLGAGAPGLAAFAGSMAARAGRARSASPGRQSYVEPIAQRSAAAGAPSQAGHSAPTAARSTAPGMAASLAGAFPIQRAASVSGMPSVVSGPLPGAGSGSTVTGPAGAATSGAPLFAGSAWASTSTAPAVSAPATIPILDGLAAHGFQAPAFPAGSQGLSLPVLARMSTAEFGVLGGLANEAGGNLWTGAGPLAFAGQGGAGWTAVGGMLHQVQRSRGAAELGSSPGAASGGMPHQVQRATRGSTDFDSIMGASLPAAGIAVSPVQTAAAGGTPGAAYGWSSQPAALASTPLTGFGPGLRQSIGLGAGATSSVQRVPAYSTTAPGAMTWSGQGHGLAAMTGGLAARALGATVIQRLATGAAPRGSRGNAEASAQWGLVGSVGSDGSDGSVGSVGSAGSGRSVMGSWPVMQRMGVAGAASGLLGQFPSSGSDGSVGSDRSGWTAAGGWPVMQRMGLADGLAGAAGSWLGQLPFGEPGGSARSVGSGGSVRSGGPAMGSWPAVQRMSTIGGTTGGLLGGVGSVRSVRSDRSGGFTGSTTGSWPMVQRMGATGGLLNRFATGGLVNVNRFATAAAIGQAAAGATERLVSTANLVGRARAGGAELASGPGAVMVSRMWSGQPLGGAMTSDQTPGAAGPLGTPVPGLPDMTQRATAASTMLAFGDLTGGGTTSSPPRSGGAPTVQVSRAVAVPPSMPALAPTSGPVVAQRSPASLAAPNGGLTTLAGRGMMVTPGVPVQREVTTSDAPSTATSTAATSESSVPTDIEALVDTVITRLKRQLALDHERAGGFRTSLLR